MTRSGPCAATCTRYTPPMLTQTAIICSLAASGVAQPLEGDLRYWAPAEREAYLAHEQSLLAAPEPDSLRAWHDMLCSRPHVAGSDGDREVISSLARSFEEMGLEVEVHEIWPLLADALAGEVEIISPIRQSLPVREPALDDDPYSGHPELMFAYNGYSGSGEAVGEVVYANFGRKEDFEKLKELGVDCTGKIVIARYSGNYRGYKAKFAEEAGAAALLIYTDPADSGYSQGLEYPEGGFASEHHIQRGSVKTLPYQGDPLTPFIEATEDAERLDPDEIALARIPIQPIGYGAASEIMRHMTGRQVEDNDWQGGLAFRYRMEGGTDLRVRVMVDQPRRIKNTANVIARLEGSEFPDEVVIVGGHHDAWGFGASDPSAGTICTLETARAFAKLAGEGQRPKRTILFCAWGAEEWGIIGSTEWVEANSEWLSKKAVAYINLDGSAMGPDFGAGASPSLKRVIVEASRAVPQAGDASKTVYEAWFARGADELYPDEPSIGDLGGGSDHVGFWCHLCIPSAGFHAGGSKGTAYHGNTDTLHWYRQTVGDDYESALMVTRMTIAVASRLANAQILPLDPGRYGPEFRKHLRAGSQEALDKGLVESIDPDLGVARSLMALDFDGRNIENLANRLADDLESSTDTLIGDRLVDVNAALRACDRAWLIGAGLSDRPWYRNFFAAPDEDSGYGAWTLPEMRVWLKDPSRLANWGSQGIAVPIETGVVEGYLVAMGRLGERIARASKIVHMLDPLPED